MVKEKISDKPREQASVVSPTSGKAWSAPSYGISFIDEGKGSKIAQTKPKKGKKKRRRKTKAPPKMGRLPKADEFDLISKAIEKAINWTQATIMWMNSLIVKMIERQKGPIKNAKIEGLDQLMAHFKTDELPLAMDIYENIQAIAEELPTLKKSSFRMISEEKCTGKSDGKKQKERGICFTLPGDKTIYCCPFTQTSSIEKTDPNVPEEMETTNYVDKKTLARTIIHEIAHYKLGIRHRQQEFSIEWDKCETGFPFRNYANAKSNAYTYDNFCYCIGGVQEAE